jgi:hypothetical protein
MVLSDRGLSVDRGIISALEIVEAVLPQLPDPKPDPGHLALCFQLDFLPWAA